MNSKLSVLFLASFLMIGMASAQAPSISNAQQSNPDTFLNEGTISADVSNSPDTVQAQVMAKERIAGGFFSPYNEMYHVNVTNVENLTMTDQDGDGTYTTEHDYDWTDMQGFNIVASNGDGTTSQMINFCTEDGCDDNRTTDDPDKMARPVKFDAIVFPGDDDRFTQEFSHDFKSDRILELRGYSLTSPYKEDQTTNITASNGNFEVVETTTPKGLTWGDPANFNASDKFWDGNRLYHQKVQVDTSNLSTGVANIDIDMTRWQVEAGGGEKLGANLMDRELVIGEALTGNAEVDDGSVTVNVSNPNPSSMFNKTVRYENNTCNSASSCKLKVKDFNNYDVSKAKVSVYVTDGETKAFVANDHVVEANSSDSFNGTYSESSLDGTKDWYLEVQAENPGGTDIPLDLSEKVREGVESDNPCKGKEPGKCDDPEISNDLPDEASDEAEDADDEEDTGSSVTGDFTNSSSGIVQAILSALGLS